MIKTQIVQLIFEIQAAAQTVLTNTGDINGLVGKIQAAGGDAFLAPYFVDDDGNPREDITVTASEISDIVAALGSISTELNTHVPVLVKGAA